MPIYIEEVVISVEVTNAAAGGAVAAPPALQERQMLIEECVERVLDILRRGEEA